MARFESDPEAAKLGEGLTALRRAAGLSQAEAGARVGMTSQGWGLYESGRRPGLFRPDVQRRLTAALGSTPEALALASAQARTDAALDAPEPGTGVESAGRAFVAPPPPIPAPAPRRMQLSNDDLAPWAASGVVLEYDPGRWPRRDQGCVIDLTDGTRLVRIYEGADGDALRLRGGPGGLAVETRLDRDRIVAVAAVLARLET